MAAPSRTVVDRPDQHPVPRHGRRVDRRGPRARSPGRRRRRASAGTTAPSNTTSSLRVARMPRASQVSMTRHARCAGLDEDAADERIVVGRAGPHQHPAQDGDARAVRLAAVQAPPAAVGRRHGRRRRQAAARRRPELGLDAERVDQGHPVDRTICRTRCSRSAGHGRRARLRAWCVMWCWASDSATAGSCSATASTSGDRVLEPGSARHRRRPGSSDARAPVVHRASNASNGNVGRGVVGGGGGADRGQHVVEVVAGRRRPTRPGARRGRSLMPGRARVVVADAIVDQTSRLFARSPGRDRAAALRTARGRSPGGSAGPGGRASAATTVPHTQRT